MAVTAPVATATADAVSSPDSTSDWAITCGTVAPSARRTPTSRARNAARPIVRFA